MTDREIKGLRARVAFVAGISVNRQTDMNMGRQCPSGVSRENMNDCWKNCLKGVCVPNFIRIFVIPYRALLSSRPNVER